MKKQQNEKRIRQYSELLTKDGRTQSPVLRRKRKFTRRTSIILQKLTKTKKKKRRWTISQKKTMETNPKGRRSLYKKDLQTDLNKLQEMIAKESKLLSQKQSKIAHNKNKAKFEPRVHSNSLNIREKTTEEVFSHILRSKKIEGWNLKDLEITLLIEIIARLRAFGDCEKLIDLSEAFYSSYAYYKASKKCLKSLLGVLSGEGLINYFEAKRSLSAFQQGCWSLTDNSAFGYAFSLVNVQLDDIQVKLPSPESPQIRKQKNTINFKISEENLEKFKGIRYLWRILLSSLDLKKLSLSSKLQGF